MDYGLIFPYNTQFAQAKQEDVLPSRSDLGYLTMIGQLNVALTEGGRGWMMIAG